MRSLTPQSPWPQESNSEVSDLTDLLFSSAVSFFFLSLPDETSKEGVIAGVIIGTILVFLLIGLIGYFICHKKRSESFSHRRLYDNTRNDPGKEHNTCFA